MNSLQTKQKTFIVISVCFIRKRITLGSQTIERNKFDNYNNKMNIVIYFGLTLTQVKTSEASIFQIF